MARSVEAPTRAPSDRLWHALSVLDIYVHGVDGARPHHPSEKIGLAYPHATGGTLTYELDFWRDTQAGLYLPRTHTQLMGSVSIGGEEIDMVLGEERITLIDDDWARLEFPRESWSEYSVLMMAERMEAILRMMQLKRPDAAWWVEQGSVVWGGDNL